MLETGSHLDKVIPVLCTGSVRNRTATMRFRTDSVRFRTETMQEIGSVLRRSGRAQGAAAIPAVDMLALLTGSRVRADLLAALFGPRPSAQGLLDLARAIGRPHQPVEQQVRRLIAAGLVTVVATRGKRTYEPNVAAPGARELAALVRQTRGRVPHLRRALVTLRTPTLAWVIQASGSEALRRFEVVILTGAPRSMVRVQLADLIPKDCPLHVMSAREWVARLDKGDVDLRRLRRTRKLWILGSWDQLVATERGVLESKRLLQRAMANWQEELSDDWDDSWDPFQPFGVAHR